MNAELTPHNATQLSARRVLVLAPHPDDEVFGCGGAIAQHVRAGTPVRVVVLSDGALYGEPGVRAEESRRAAAVLGYGAPEFWELPDGGIRADETLVERLAEAMRETQADLVYAPSPWEVHPDHRHTATAAIQAAQRVDPALRLAFFEVGAPLRPNVLQDITPVLELKQRAMHSFASQLAKQDYAAHISGLNTYRTYTLPRDVAAAEAFLVVPARELADPAQRTSLLALASAGFGIDAGGATPPAELPLVSVLIRSTDRPYLAQALDSVALQTYPRIEVVVVAAKPGHRPVAPWCGPFPLRLVSTEQPLPRSRAANAALDAAQGELLLLLDDDDWLLPDHISRLARVLAQQPQVHAAYSDVEQVDANGRPLGNLFDLAFDPLRQAASNMLPIHSVLFRRSLVAEGCRFDEALDRYEDWDFWLQLQRRTSFAHVPGVSAAYRIHQSSGVHTDAGHLGTSTAEFHNRWAEGLQPGQISHLMERVWLHSVAEAQLAQAKQTLLQREQSIQQQALALERITVTAALHEQTIAHRERVIEQQQQSAKEQAATIALHAHAEAELRATAQRLEHTIAALQASRSWRITAPMRWAGSAARRALGRGAGTATGGLARARGQVQRLLPLAERALRYWRVHGFKALLRDGLARARAGQAVPAGPSPTQPAEPKARAAAPGWIGAREVRHPSEVACTPLRLYSAPSTGVSRITMVTDSINRGSLFGGVGTALILAALLAEARGSRLRIMTRTERAEPDNVGMLLATYGLRLTHEVEFAFASVHDASSEFDVSEGELFLTTSWWTTAATMGSVRHDAIVYLLQEDERMFYPFGDERRRCEEVLRTPDIRYVVNTRLLFDHLVGNGLPHLAEAGRWFEPAFPPALFHPRPRPAGGRRKLMFYARPHNLRNLFYFGIALLETAVVRGVIDLAAWDIVLVGKDIPALRFGEGYTPERRENMGWGEYAQLAGEVDLGLCLMYTPHPSYPPFDLAASGAVVVTNRHGLKQDLSGYSRNIVCGDLDLEAMLQALAEGLRLAADTDQRARNHAGNQLGTDWRAAFAEIVQAHGKAG